MSSRAANRRRGKNKRFGTDLYDQSMLQEDGVNDVSISCRNSQLGGLIDKLARKSSRSRSDTACKY